MTLLGEVIARGEVTVLRTFKREDVDAWIAWPPHRDPLFYSSNPRPMSKSERDLWFAERSRRSDYSMYAVDDLQDSMVGWISIRNINRRAGSSVLGISFSSTQLSRGLGTDALEAFLDYYFGPLGFRKMYLDVAAYNGRARRCYEKCGFHYIGEHWGYFGEGGEEVMQGPRYQDVRQWFRRLGREVQTLFLDMEIGREEHLAQRRRSQAPSPTAG